MKAQKNHEFITRCFVSKKKNIGKFTIFFFFLVGVSGCNPFHSQLNELGNSNYNDVKIPLDFNLDDFDESNDNSIQSVISNEQPQQTVQQHQQVLRKNQVSFVVEDEIFALAHGQALRWNGCYRNQNTMGGYGSDRNCGNAFLQKNFHNHLNFTFFRCIEDSAQAAGYPKPVKVLIHHLGTYNNRQTRDGRRLSLHALAAAMDIIKFRLFESSGNSYIVSTFKRHYHGSQAVFYDEFRNCWKQSLPDKCTSGKIEYEGSIGHTASKLGGSSTNNDHLHLSLPYCAMDGANLVSRRSLGHSARSAQSGANPSGRQRQTSSLPRNRIFNCNNTLYRRRNYFRHSCLKSMGLEDKARLVMNDVSTINRLRPEFKLDPRFSFCVAYYESGITPNARGAGNDYGIYQITNSTARDVLRMHTPVVPFFSQYRRSQTRYRKAMLKSTLAQADLYHSVMFAKAKQEKLLHKINRNPENVALLRRLATSYNGSGRRARYYGQKVARCYQSMKQVVSRTGHIHKPSEVRQAVRQWSL